MFNAYATNSQTTILTHAAAKKLIDKLLLLDLAERSELRIATGYQKHHGLPSWLEIPQSLKPFTGINDTQVLKLVDFLNKNDIECKVSHREQEIRSRSGNFIGVGTWKYIDFPGLTSKDELIVKLNAIYAPHATQGESSRARQANIQ